MLIFLVALSATASARAAFQDPTYFGGPVLHHEQVVLVEWGADVEPTFTNTTTGDPAFFDYLQSQTGATTDLPAVLAQYGDDIDGVAGNAVNAPTYDTEIQIAPSHGGGGNTATVTDAQIQAQLDTSITAGELPAPLAGGLGTIYVVLFPPKDTITQGGENSVSGFCAYHNTGSTSQVSGDTSHPLLYEVVPDTNNAFTGNGCGPGSTELANETSVLSHEFAETITDPEIGFDTQPGYASPAGWASNANNEGEIADICDTGAGDTAANGPWTVQKVWSNLDGACEGSESLYSAPIGSISPPETVTAGASATFSGDAAADPTSNTIVSGHGLSLSAPFGPGLTSYDWDWDDDSTDSTGADPSHVFAQAGDYTVGLTVTDTLGFTGTTEIQIEVTNPAAPSVTSSAATTVSATGATLNGTINPWGHPTSYRFEYGTSPSNLGLSTTVTDAGSGTVAEAENATLSGLAAGATYYYELVGTYGSGSTVEGEVESFTTTVTAPPPPAPVPTTGTATGLSTSGATLNGTLNPDGLTVSYAFAWGTSASALTHTTAATTGPTATSSQPVAAQLTGLQPGTTYYYRLAVEHGSKFYSGSVVSFTTAATRAAVTLGAPSEVSAAAATLAGMVDPEGFATTYLFEYGKTTSYGQSSTAVSAGAGTSPQTVTAQIGGLVAHTTYHYRLVATSVGGTVSTGDGTFTTSKQTQPPKLAFTIPSGQSIKTALSKGIKVSFTCDETCSATFGAHRASSAAVDIASAPATVASGAAKLPHGGKGTAKLRLTTAGRNAIKDLSKVTIVIGGTAKNSAGAAGKPVDHDVTLRSPGAFSRTAPAAARRP
jgi:PKD repeat protein